MHMTLSTLLAAAALVPWPKEANFTGGEVPVTKAVYAADANLPKEGYRLSVTKNGVNVWSSTDAGRFYADKTLEQLAESGKYACCEITDEPAFPYRGFHVDEARHFFGKDAIKKVIDEMSRMKMNCFHWHLTDDQGWRIGLKKFPELTQYGSIRPCSPVFGWEWQRKYDDTPYGPFFYTEEEAREIVAYAAERHVTIIPEIDLPGHCQGLLAGYPEMLCEGETLKPRAARKNWWLAGIRTLCIGNDEALAKVEAILDEVMKIFPGEYFHFGGDECPDRYWAKCPKCKARMEIEGFKNAHQLQGWFTRRFSGYLAGKGRKPIGWNEVLGGGVPKSCVIMSWTGTHGGIAAARQGNFAIMTPSKTCYLNRWDGNHALNEFTTSAGLSGGTAQSMDAIYTFDPLEGVPANARRFILGGQCCVWSEFVFTPAQLEWRLFPRSGAIAETLWTAPAKRDYRSFRARIDKVRAGQAARGVSAAPVIDFPAFTAVGEWKVAVEWGTDRVEFDVPKGSATRGAKAVKDKRGAVPYGPQRLDRIVRTRGGKLEYRVGKEVEHCPPLPEVADGELLGGTVWVTAQTETLTDDNLYPCRARRFYRPKGRWNDPLARDACPNTIKKLRNGQQMKILVWEDVPCAEQRSHRPEGRWQDLFAEYLKKAYPKSHIEWRACGAGGSAEASLLAQQIVGEKPDLVISRFMNDDNPGTDRDRAVEAERDAVSRNYEKIYAAFKEAGIEWVICVPHYIRPDRMGKKTVRECQNDPRPYCKFLRRFCASHKVCLADPTRYWSALCDMGIPYPILFENGINLPNAHGMKFYADALADLFQNPEQQ
jgi:hexosaminidase